MLTSLLDHCSIELTAQDRAARRAVIERMPPGSEIFIADLPDQPPDVVGDAATDLRRAGFEPVPHLVARNLASREQIDRVFGPLCRELGLRQLLVTGGDRAEPAGPFGSALDIIQSGVLGQLNISRVVFPCYPEGHPRISAAELADALDRKLAASRAAGIEVSLASQFAFDARPVLAFVRSLREKGIDTPLRIGTAGPAARDTLVAFGRDLGAGPSLDRIEGPDCGKETVTPEQFLGPIANAVADEPSLGITGAHLFPFGSIEACLGWTEAYRRPAR